MAKTKVKVLLPFVMRKQPFGLGDEISLDQEVAYKFALKGVVEFKTKKEFEELDKSIKAKAAEEKAKREEAEKAAAILHKEELEAERTKLQVRVDDITDALGDGEVYYKSYVDLGKGK